MEKTAEQLIRNTKADREFLKITQLKPSKRSERSVAAPARRDCPRADGASGGRAPPQARPPSPRASPDFDSTAASGTGRLLRGLAIGSAAGEAQDAA